MQVQPLGKGEPLTNKHKIEVHKEIAESAEEKAVGEAVEKPFEELAETKFYDFTGDKWTSFFRKIARFLDFTKFLGGSLNSNVIIRGSLKEWDPQRLEKRHNLLNKFGAEHLQFTSKTHEKVDAHYLDASKFLHRLEEMGGKRKVLKFDIPEDSPFYKAKKVNVLVEGELSITMHEIDTSKVNLDDKETLQAAVGTFLRFGKKLVKDETTGKFYVIDLTSYNRLLKTTYHHTPEGASATDPGIFRDFEIDGEGKWEDNFLNFKQEIPAIEFKREDFEKHKDIQLERYLYQTGWDFVFLGDTYYLTRRNDCPQAEMFFLQNRVKDPEMTLQIADAKPLETTKKTIILTQNQTDIYEQHINEILTYALEGINVLVYNNPGKGLSTGLADNTNLNASIEAAYLYLHDIKKIKDKDIIAKGQCFGAAPTGWLGRQHPKINIIMDQNLANFHEKVMEEIRLRSNEAVIMSKKRKELEILKPKVLEIQALEDGIKQIIGIESEKISNLRKEKNDLDQKRMDLMQNLGKEKEVSQLIELMNQKDDEIEAIKEKINIINDKIQNIKAKIKEIVELEVRIQDLRALANSSEELKAVSEELKVKREELTDLEEDLLPPGIPQREDRITQIQKLTAKILEIARRRDPAFDETSKGFAEKVTEVEEFKYKYLEAWAPYIIKLNYIVEGLVRALFSGYNTADDIRANQGNKLIHINVAGFGGPGDELVLPHHPEMMIESAPVTRSPKVVKLSMNPGGKHVTDWWLSWESREAVMDFFIKTKSLANLTERASEFGEKLKAIPMELGPPPRPARQAPSTQQEPKARPLYDPLDPMRLDPFDPFF